MKTVERRLDDLERKIDPGEGTQIVDLGNGTLEIRWGDKLMCRVRKDLYEELLDTDDTEKESLC